MENERKVMKAGQENRTREKREREIDKCDEAPISAEITLIPLDQQHYIALQGTSDVGGAPVIFSYPQN